MKPLGISQVAFAERVGWSQKHVNRIIKGRNAITVEGALVLSKALGTTPDFWIELQKACDLYQALRSERIQARITGIEPLKMAS